LGQGDGGVRQRCEHATAPPGSAGGAAVGGWRPRLGRIRQGPLCDYVGRPVAVGVVYPGHLRRGPVRQVRAADVAGRGGGLAQRAQKADLVGRAPCCAQDGVRLCDRGSAVVHAPIIAKSDEPMATTGRARPVATVNKERHHRRASQGVGLMEAVGRPTGSMHPLLPPDWPLARTSHVSIILDMMSESLYSQDVKQA